MSKSKIVLVIDLSSSNLQQAVQVASNYTLERLYNYPDNSIALILTGTIETEVSQINGNVDNFSNMTVVRALLLGNKELVQDILDLPRKYATKHTKVNQFYGAEAALRLFYQEKSKTHWMSENRIMLFTDELAQFGGDVGNLATEMGGIKPEIVFKLIGPDLEDLQKLSRDCTYMSKFCSQIGNGEALNIEDALQITSLYKTKKFRQYPLFKGCLEIGSGAKFPVYILNKITPASHQQSMKMCDGEGGGVARDRVYHLQDENQTPVDPDCMNKGYKYGKSYIPISKVDASLMSSETSKQLSLICTTKRRNVRREELFGKQVFSVTVPQTDHSGGLGLSAFAAALQQLDMVAICRYVKKEDSKPKICCLIPNIKDYCTTLLMVELPFSNEIKKAEFPPIRKEPSSEQLEAIDSLIDSMDLATKPEFKSSEIPNPSIQRRFDCVKHKAFNPDKAYPALPVNEMFRIPTFDTSDSVKKCTSVFEIKMAELKSKKRDAGEMFNTTNVEVKKLKTEDVNFDDLLDADVQIGTTTPVADFQQACTKLGPGPACSLLCDVITRFLQHNTPGHVSGHVTPCIRALREVAVQQGCWELFNTWLQGAIKNDAVRGICKENNWSLIHRGECSESTVSGGEAEFFLRGDEIPSEMDLKDDDDDLLDDL